MQCFNNYKHLLLFLFGLMVMLFTSALIIYIWLLLTVGGLDIMTNVCMYNKITLCIKFIKHNRNMQYRDVYMNQLFMDIKRNTSGGHL